MGNRRHTPEQIITALREPEVGLANGKTVAQGSPPASAIALGTGAWPPICIVGSAVCDSSPRSHGRNRRPSAFCVARRTRGRPRVYLPGPGPTLRQE